MIDYYLMEKMMEFQKKEIEQVERHAWNWLNFAHSKFSYFKGVIR